MNLQLNPYDYINININKNIIEQLIKIQIKIKYKNINAYHTN